MVTLTFEFNEKALAERGLTKDLFLEDMRSYSKKFGIIENDFGVFEKDGEHALCLLLKKALEILEIVPYATKYLKKLELNVDGEIENCIVEYRRCIKNGK